MTLPPTASGTDGLSHLHEVSVWYYCTRVHRSQSHKDCRLRRFLKRYDHDTLRKSLLLGSYGTRLLWQPFMHINGCHTAILAFACTEFVCKRLHPLSFALSGALGMPLHVASHGAHDH